MTTVRRYSEWGRLFTFGSLACAGNEWSRATTAQERDGPGKQQLGYWGPPDGLPGPADFSAHRARGLSPSCDCAVILFCGHYCRIPRGSSERQEAGLFSEYRITGCNRERKAAWL